MPAKAITAHSAGSAHSGRNPRASAGTTHAAASSGFPNVRSPKQSAIPASDTATSAIEPPVAPAPMCGSVSGSGWSTWRVATIASTR